MKFIITRVLAFFPFFVRLCVTVLWAVPTRKIKSSDDAVAWAHWCMEPIDRLSPRGREQNRDVTGGGGKDV